MLKKLNKRSCGDCTFCCKVLPIEEVKSPPNIMCSHCTISEKCSIYDKRPKACRDFSCEWLLDATIPEDIRPDISGVMFESITENIQLAMVHPENLEAWSLPSIHRYIDRLNKIGISVIVSSFTNSSKIFILAEGKTQEEVMKEAMVEYNKEFKNK